MRVQVLRPLVKEEIKNLGMDSLAAENLLLGTAAVETDMGLYLKQIEGPARGIYQMEPDTEKDIWQTYLSVNPQIAAIVSRTMIPHRPFNQALGNFYYATAMARVHYWRFPEPLPEHDDVDGLATYWKKYYNTRDGSGTVEDFVIKYQAYVVHFA